MAAKRYRIVNSARLRMARPVAKLREGRTDWYRITNRSDGAEIYIYDEIGYFGTTAKDFVHDLNEIDRDRIALHLNTPGGEVFDGFAIYEALRQHRAEITVYVDALAASIGSVIAMAGDHRIVARQSQMMIHDGMGICVGNAADMAEMINQLDRVSDNIASVYADRAGGTPRQWRDRMKAETWYSAKEAVEAGLADEVAGNSSASNSWDLSIYGYAGRGNAPAPELDPVPTIAATWDPSMFRAAVRGALA